MQVRIPFEVSADQQLRKLRRLAREEQAPEMVGYVDQLGEQRGLTGDQYAPYVHAIGRASSDGSTGSVSVLDGDPQRILTDELGILWTRPAPGVASSDFSTALEQTNVIKAGAGRLWGVRMLVTTGIAADRWLMAFNSTTAPINGAAPTWRALLANPGGSRAEISDTFFPGLEFSTGIALAISTSEVTLTLPGANEALFSAQYE